MKFEKKMILTTTHPSPPPPKKKYLVNLLLANMYINFFFLGIKTTD